MVQSLDLYQATHKNIIKIKNKKNYYSKENSVKDFRALVCRQPFDTFVMQPAYIQALSNYFRLKGELKRNIMIWHVL